MCVFLIILLYSYTYIPVGIFKSFIIKLQMPANGVHTAFIIHLMKAVADAFNGVNMNETSNDQPITNYYVMLDLLKNIKDFDGEFASNKAKE